MPELKDKDVRKVKCHFCRTKTKTKFQFDLQRDTIKYTIRSVPVCRPHFNVLCDMTYSILDGSYAHLPSGQREYVAVKHLESKLGVKNTIQFNK